MVPRWKTIKAQEAKEWLGKFDEKQKKADEEAEKKAAEEKAATEKKAADEKSAAAAKRAASGHWKE